MIQNMLPPSLGKLCSRDEASVQSVGGSETGVRPGVSLQEVERDLILKTLRIFGGNRTRTAEALGLSRRALLYKLKKYEDDGV